MKKKKIKKILSKVLNTFENIMENGANAPFIIVFSNMLYFKGVKKALLWSKGLKAHADISRGARGLIFGLSLPQLLYFMYARSGGSGKTQGR